MSPRERLEDDLRDALLTEWWGAHKIARRQLLSITERVMNGEAEDTTPPDEADTDAIGDYIEQAYGYSFKDRDEWTYHD